MANTGSARAEKKSAAKDDAAKDSGAGGPGGSAGLKIHHLRPAPGARTAKTRVGRGEASKGKTAGRGTKGSKARTTISPAFEGGQMPLHRRLPKLKGFSNARFKTTYQVVNLDRLAALYPQGGDVTPEDLAERGAESRESVRLRRACRTWLSGARLTGLLGSLSRTDQAASDRGAADDAPATWERLMTLTLRHQDGAC